MVLSGNASFKKRIVVFILILSALLFSCNRRKQKPLVIGAASSMTSVMKELAIEYNNQYKKNVELSFAASGIISTQIEEGAPINIFISADLKYLDTLKQAGMVVKSIILCKNKLVLAVNKKFPLQDRMQILNDEKIKKIGIGNPFYSPAGRYAVDILKKNKLYNLIKCKFIYGSNVRQVLSWVETGDVDTAFIYKTDAALSNQLSIIKEWSTISGKSIDYPAIIIKTSYSYTESQKFLDFLESGRARKILHKFGFDT